MEKVTKACSEVRQLFRAIIPDGSSSIVLFAVNRLLSFARKSLAFGSQLIVRPAIHSKILDSIRSAAGQWHAMLDFQKMSC